MEKGLTTLAVAGLTIDIIKKKEEEAYEEKEY